MILKNVEPYIQGLKAEYKERIKNFKEAPKLAIIQVGETKIASIGIENKVKDCEEVGVVVDVYIYPENITEFELDNELAHMQEHYDGVVIQMPLPPHIRSSIASAAPNKDVGGTCTDSWFDAVVPKGIMGYLEYCGYDISGRDVVIIGRGEATGRALAKRMVAANATVTLCHSQSKLSKYIYDCDLLVSAVGKAGFLNCYPIHVPIIDIGMSVNEDGKVVGDCYNIENRDVLNQVDLLTRCALLENVIESKERSMDG